MFETIAGQEGVRGSQNATDGKSALFSYPTGVAVDSSGNVFVADWVDNTIRKISAGGAVTTVAGQSGQTGFVDGPAASARFNAPQDVAVDPDGNLYVTDFRNQAIRRISPEGEVTTIAGGSFGFADGIGSEAQFQGPNGIVVEASGDLIVSDIFGNNLRRVTLNGAVTTLAGIKALGPTGGHKCFPKDRA